MRPRDPRGRVSARLRALAGRRRGRSRLRGGYRDWIERAEPALIERPRVHRFAAPPVLGAPGAPATELCVWVIGAGDVEATRSSLDAQTVAPAQVVEAAQAEGLSATSAPWIALVRAGDRLAPTALERLGQGVALAADARVLTCDDDELTRSGRRARPRCGPGPSPDALLAGEQAGPPVVVAREAALAAQVGAGTAWELELLLALAGSDGAGHAHVPQILIHRAGRPDSDDEAQAAAVARIVPEVRVERTGPGRRRLRRAVAGEPSVEVIVCLRDRVRLLRRCARSVLERSTYERLSLRVVDNHSSQPAVLTLLDQLEHDPRVTVMRDSSPFNFAALNNRAAGESQADFLVFLNNDTEVITPTWIEELLEEAQREEVGAVAPLLRYPDGRVQHAGAALGVHGYAGHPFAGLDPDSRTAFGAAADGARNWLAVSAACLMLERRKFEAVGGFDESFAVAGNDVDLCLRLTAAGHRSLCLPDVRLHHDESASRDPLAIPEGDFERSRQRYGDFRTIGDPFYNPNLTLAATTCALRGPEEIGR